MGKTRDLFKKIRDTKGTFHAKMGLIKDKNGMVLTEAEDIKRWQEYWSGLPLPSPEGLPDPGMEPTSPVSPALQADSLPTEPVGKTLRARNRSKLPLCLAGLRDIFCTLAELENLLLSE